MDKKENINMADELFEMSVQNVDFLLPPKSKEECIASLKDHANPDERMKSLVMLVEIYRLEGLRSGGRYREQGCEELIVRMKMLASTSDLKERVARIALKEGAYCEKIGDIPKAIQFYQASNDIYKLNDPWGRYFQINNLAYCLNFALRFSEAETLLREATALLPDQYNAWKNLGVSLEHQGQFEEAAECFLKAINLSGGEHRSRWHFERLIERHPSLRKILDDNEKEDEK